MVSKKKMNQLQTISQYWPTVLYGLILLFVVEVALHQSHLESMSLQRKLNDLAIKMNRAEKERETLLLQLASLDDPAWIEQVLIRDLGLVPEGKRKIILD
jgi:hypothetical protein